MCQFGLWSIDQMVYVYICLTTFVCLFHYRYSAYNGMTPLYPPTGSWSSLMSRMKYNTIEDYNKAFTRLTKLGTYVITSS